MTRPMAVRLAWGRLHLAGPTGRGYRAVCGRVLEGEDLVAYWGTDVGRAWRLEVTCLDCEARLRRARTTRARQKQGLGTIIIGTLTGARSIPTAR